jgi:hypothetical protein
MFVAAYAAYLGFLAVAVAAAWLGILGGVIAAKMLRQPVRHLWIDAGLGVVGFMVGLILMGFPVNREHSGPAALVGCLGLPALCQAALKLTRQT